MIAPNRLATYLTAAAGLATAIVVPLGNLDTSSTAGVISGLAAIVVVAVKWLHGWQQHEARHADSTPVDVDTQAQLETTDGGVDPEPPVDLKGV